MIKYFCDKCGKEETDRLYELPIHVHIMQDNPLEGHSKIVDDKFYSTSGVTKTISMCIKCYNEVMYPLWDSIKADVKI